MVIQYIDLVVQARRPGLLRRQRLRHWDGLDFLLHEAPPEKRNRRGIISSSRAGCQGHGYRLRSRVVQAIASNGWCGIKAYPSCPRHRRGEFRQRTH